MTETPEGATERFRDALTLQLVRNGASADHAQQLVKETDTELASGHTLARVGKRFFQLSQVEEIASAHGYSATANTEGQADAIAAGKAAAATQRAALAINPVGLR